MRSKVFTLTLRSAEEEEEEEGAATKEEEEEEGEAQGVDLYYFAGGAPLWLPPFLPLVLHRRH